MDTNFEYWIQSNQVHLILVIWISFILEKFWRISATANPLVFYRILCTRLANKVSSDIPNQARLSGFLGGSLLAAPICIIFYLVHEFAGYQTLLDILLLWMLLQFSAELKSVEKSVDALSNDKPKLAKELLKNTVIRETSSLSPLGVSKTAIECLYLKYHHQQIAVLFWYLVLGPTAALAYRLIYETQQVWNIKLSQYTDFGMAPFFITKILQLPSNYLFNNTFLLLTNPIQFSGLIFTKNYWALSLTLFNFTQNYFYLFVLGHSLNINTGGPCIYNNNKVRRPRFLEPQTKMEPDVKNVSQLITIINNHRVAMLIVATLILAWQV